MASDWRLTTEFGPVFPGMVSPPLTSQRSNNNNVLNAHASSPPPPTNFAVNHITKGLRITKNIPARMACIGGGKGSLNSKHTLSRSDVDNSKKRYVCNQCNYSTDRRDLFRRHENIHRDEKPFHCYVCTKMFNRADHVKKHFLRIHKGLEYNVKLIKRVKGVDYTPSSNCNGETQQTNNLNNHNEIIRNGDINNNSTFKYQNSLSVLCNESKLLYDPKHERANEHINGHDLVNCSANFADNYDQDVENTDFCLPNSIPFRFDGFSLNTNKSSFHKESPSSLPTPNSLSSTLVASTPDHGQENSFVNYLQNRQNHHLNRTSITHPIRLLQDYQPRSHLQNRQSNSSLFQLEDNQSSQIIDSLLKAEKLNSSSLCKEYGSLPYASLIFNTHPDQKKIDWVHRLNPVKVGTQENQCEEDMHTQDACLDKREEDDYNGKSNCNDRHRSFQRHTQNLIDSKVDESPNSDQHFDNEEETCLFDEDDDSVCSDSSSTLSNSDRLYECEFCGCAFVNYPSLHTHRYLLHYYLTDTEICYPYSCVLCGKRGPTQRMMIGHMERHVRPKVRYYRLVCRKTYKDCDKKLDPDELANDYHRRHRRKQIRPRKVIKSPLKVIARYTHLNSSCAKKLPPSLKSSSFLSPKTLSSQFNSRCTQENITDCLDDDNLNGDILLPKLTKTQIAKDASCIEDTMVNESVKTSKSNGSTECKLCHRPFVARSQACQESN